MRYTTSTLIAVTVMSLNIFAAPLGVEVSASVFDQVVCLTLHPHQPLEPPKHGVSDQKWRKQAAS